ncbi:MAG: SpoIIE family protein phosphatase [Phycisphaeraceae bacterium]|nr:SpoIIE family protein phosphatase [Phycisphaeraceae bacterium]
MAQPHPNPVDPADPAGDPAQPDRGPLTLRDFVTDASLVAVCDELTRMTGVPIWMRDAGGSAIVPGDRGAAWITVSDESAAERAFELAGRAYVPAAPTFRAVLRISTGELGHLVMAEPVPGTGKQRHSLRNALTRLAATVSEGCEAQVSLRQRVLELGALYRLSSMLVQSEDADSLLTAALDLAMDVLRVDGGSISLVEDEEADLVVKASRGLSPEWVAGSASAAHASTIRKAALGGEIIAVDDLTTDPRMPDPERVRVEGLVSLLSTGLMYQGRAIGLIRLYARTPRRFTRAEKGLLRSIADQSAAAVINARLRRLREENERVRHQVRLAANVQRRMLPRAMPTIPALDIAAKYQPTTELGGDFYDLIPLSGNLGIVVGDVVGKGVPAALLMSAVRASLRAHAQDVYDLKEVLARVNAALAADTHDDEFATLWYGVIDPATLRLTYCNAGHNPPLLIRRSPGRPVRAEDITELAEGGMALGIDASQRYSGGVCQLAPGDMLVGFTDGLIDALSFAGRRFGNAGLTAALLETLNSAPDSSAAHVAERLFWHLRQHTGLHARTDDVTLVVVRVRAG